MIKFLQIFIVIFMFVGCETVPQQSTSEPVTPPKIPSAFLGSAGYEYVPDSFKVIGKGTYKKGDIFAEKEFRFTRIGVMQNETSFSYAFEKNKLIQGDKLYALQVRDTEKQMEIQKPSIMWCKPTYSRPVLNKIHVPICVLWVNENKAAYWLLTASRNPYWDFNMGFFGTSPQFEEVPDIADGDYKLDVTLKMQLVFHKTSKKGYKFRVKYTDGTRDTVYLTDGVVEERDGNSFFKVWGGEFW